MNNKNRGNPNCFLKKDIILFKNEIVSVHETEDCNIYMRWPASVVIIPFRLSDEQNYEFMFNKEYMSTIGFALRPITCILGDGETAAQCAVRELREETGYIIDEEDLIFYSYLEGSSAIIHPTIIYFVDVTNKEKVEEFDGEQENIQNLWLRESIINDMILDQGCVDFIIGACYVKTFLEIGLKRK